MDNFRYQIQISVQDTDITGRIYCSQLFNLAQRALTEFLDQQGYSLKQRLIEKDYVFPIVHMSGDFYQEISLEDKLTIGMKCLKIGDSSFHLEYPFFKGETLVAKALFVHCTISVKNQKKIPIPEKLKKILVKKYLFMYK